MKMAKPADVGLDATRLGRLTSTLKDDIASTRRLASPNAEAAGLPAPTTCS